MGRELVAASKEGPGHGFVEPIFSRALPQRSRIGQVCQVLIDPLSETSVDAYGCGREPVVECEDIV